MNLITFYTFYFPEVAIIVINGPQRFLEKIAVQSHVKVAHRYYLHQVFTFLSDIGRYAVFCLVRVGGEVQDTELICTDKTTTDVSFRDVLVL